MSVVFLIWLVAGATLKKKEHWQLYFVVSTKNGKPMP